MTRLSDRPKVQARYAAMEPAREERDDRHHLGLCDGRATYAAAMEPAPEERDDSGRRARRSCSLPAAMEPAPEERDDVQRQQPRLTPVSRPQWSPLLKSGMTVRHVRRLVDRLVAAMEPAPEERDDGAVPAGGYGRGHRAAMDPAPEERDDQSNLVNAHGSFLPQWSPLLKSGMTRALRALVMLDPVAAMEPAPEERDDRHGRTEDYVDISSPQWSPLLKSGMTSPGGW